MLDFESDPEQVYSESCLGLFSGAYCCSSLPGFCMDVSVVVFGLNVTELLVESAIRLQQTYVGCFKARGERGST